MQEANDLLGQKTVGGEGVLKKCSQMVIAEGGSYEGSMLFAVAFVGSEITGGGTVRARRRQSVGQQSGSTWARHAEQTPSGRAQSLAH